MRMIEKLITKGEQKMQTKKISVALAGILFFLAIIGGKLKNYQKFTLKRLTSLTAGFCLLLMVSIAHAATLDIRDGHLFGAADVDVNGSLYDVAFRDGTAIELYGGADANTDFPFTNLLDLNDNTLAELANQALLDQVFVGEFDSSTVLINGCGAIGGCNVWTPQWVNTGGTLGIVGVFNASDAYGHDDYIFAGSSYRTFDTGWWSAPSQDYTVYAVWSKTASVPIPGAVWLFGSGLVGLIGLRRKKK